MEKDFKELKIEYHKKTIEIAKQAIELLEALEDDSGAIEELKERIAYSEGVLKKCK